MKPSNSFLVYGLYKQQKLIYVGHTTNLTRKIEQHKKQKKFNEYKILHSAKNLKLSLYYERKIIRTMYPPLNRAYNPLFNEEKTLQYIKNTKKIIKKQKQTSSIQKKKSISSREFIIFKDKRGWEITKPEIKEDEKYLQEILSMVKQNTFLNIQMMSLKIKKYFGERLPTNVNRLDQWIHLALKIFRDEERSNKNEKIQRKQQKQTSDKIKKQIIIQKIINMQQKERTKKVFDSVDEDVLGIVKPNVSNKL